MVLTIKAVIFDFGGVLAEEGFRDGLLAIGAQQRLDPEAFQKTADDLIHETGYVTGHAEESFYWDALRRATGISGSNDELRQEILKRFVLRPEMLAAAECVKTHGLHLAILSDQTNWLDEIDRRTPFLHHFPYTFNSYKIKKSKRDRSVFADVCAAMGVSPAEALFVDDNIDNINRAREEGLQVIPFWDVRAFREQLDRFIRCPESAAPARP